MSVWTEDRVERLKALWRDGQSAGAIAMELEQSRNAVIGKIGRLGLLGRGAPSVKAARSNRPRSAEGLIVANAKRRVERLAKSPGLPPEPTPPPQAPTSLRLTLDELTSRTCRWLSGHPGSADFSFCGQNCPVEKPYCGYHAAIASNPRARP